jgi:hypothetical protein
VAQPIGSVAPVNGANWQSIGGGGGGGGNWSWRGNFNTTSATAYALNDVVFDSVNTTDTYICILAYTTTVPTPTAPSANTTNWLLLAQQVSGDITVSSVIAEGGFSTPGQIVASPDTALGLYCKKSVGTGVATGVAFGTGVYPSELGLTWDGDSSNPYIVASASATIGSPAVVSTTVSAPLALFGDTWVATQSYCSGTIVISPANSNSYVANKFIVGNAGNTDPSTTTADWIPLGAGGGGGGSSISLLGSTVAITPTTGAITLDATASTGTQPDVLIKPDNNTTCGVKIETNTTSAIFDNYGAGGATVGKIQLVSTDATNPATVSIGGAVNNTGLYVSNTQLLFNGSAVGGGGGGTSITAGGSTLGIDAGGTLSLTTTDVASNTNKVEITTIIPTTTPGTNAGRISITAGEALQLGCAVGDMTLTNTAGAGAGGITLSTANKIELTNTGAGGTVINTGAGITPLFINPPANFGTGAVPYNCGLFNNQYGYNLGSIVQETAGGGSYVCITAVAPNTTAPYNPNPSATPASWLPLGAGGGGMELAPGANATWSDTAGYAVGSVVNNTSPVGIYVCIQTIPATTPPAVNPNPSSSPTFWVELISNTTAPGSAMVYDNAWSATQGYSAQTVVAYTSTSGTVINFICILAITAPVSPAVNPNPDVDATHWLQFGAVVLSTSWSATEQYNVGTILNDPQYGSFNCVLTAPVGSPAPWLQTSPIYWASLTQGYCYFYGDYDLTGATPYPVGSIVNSGGSWWIANTIYVPPAPPVVLPPINSSNTNWSFFVSTVSGLNGLAITNPYPVPPAVPSGTVLNIATDTNFTATAPFQSYTGNLGNTGFVAGGTGIALIPGSRYSVSYNMSFNGIPNNNNISSATWQVRMTFNMTATGTQATSFYDIYNSGSQGGSGNAVPSANFNGSFVFTAPVDATFVGIQVQNNLDTGTGFPESTSNQFCSVSFASLTSGLLITSLG